MWWSSPSMGPGGRRLPALALLALVGLSAPLAGCGWQPLYGVNKDTGAAGSAAQQMAQIHINPIADRVGQQLYNLLRDRMNPQGVPQNPTYDLIVTLRQSGAPSLINPDQTTARIDLTLYASFSLYRRDAPGVVVFKGESRNTTSYDLLISDPYASVVSADDAKRRGAQSLADDIANRLATYLAQPRCPTRSPRQRAPDEGRAAGSRAFPAERPRRASLPSSSTAPTRGWCASGQSISSPAWRATSATPSASPS